MEIEAGAQLLPDDRVVMINIASTDAKRYRDETVSIGCAISKPALLELPHAAGFDGWYGDVRATALCPGAVDTELIQGITGVEPGRERIPPETIPSMQFLDHG